MRFFCGAFLQKSDLLCPQAHRHFSFCELFLFVPLVSKRKSGLTVWMALLQRFCKAQTDTPLSFDTKGAKESSQRKRRLGHFARPASDKAYAALTRAHWRGGSYGLQCEHTAKLTFLRKNEQNLVRQRILLEIFSGLSYLLIIYTSV